MTVNLGEIFQNQLLDSDWLKNKLSEIEVRFAPNIPKEDEGEKVILPQWLPDLKGIYSLMVIIMLRYPTSLAKHVFRKFQGS